ncbi:hypothetical protein DVT68_08355 [Dyella solisilvae]|uniref:Uncharacterized protein n=1 Tax=Dyella solisilvae TaxID=1920168 RepID=A0A370K7D1_9GAMM|nr:hypothetical protein [Dyella solisilvae]RDI98533.1 hypothetical protein DVT68_08355 [Dyella solisilvae]
MNAAVPFYGVGVVLLGLALVACSNEAPADSHASSSATLAVADAVTGRQATREDADRVPLEPIYIEQVLFTRTDEAADISYEESLYYSALEGSQRELPGGSNIRVVPLGEDEVKKLGREH